MKITSSAFENYQNIPPRYTCDGENINPPLEFFDIPNETVSLVIIVDDPDAVNGTWNHWLLWNINPNKGKIAEGQKPEGAVEGVTSFGTQGYGGPCPPVGTGNHRYIFTLYALSQKLDIPATSKKDDLLKFIEKMIIAKATLTGIYTHDKS